MRAFDQLARVASAALVDARVAQLAYVAVGQGLAFWTGKTDAAVKSANAALTALRASAGPGARTAIDEAAETVVEFSSIDTRARDYLKTGQQLMAGDVIFTEGSDAAATAVHQIETARMAQHQAVDVEVAALRRQQMVTAGGAAGVVILVVLVLMLMPAPRAGALDRTADAGLSIRQSAAEVGGSAPAPPPVMELELKPVPAPLPVAPITAQARGSVFKAATDVATDFGRVRDLDELTRVLGRAAEVMDATGLMVWVGSASGADLRPVLAHGYSAEMIARIPPVPRSANNAAASAYRSGTLQIVLSHPGSSSGAVVAPILSADGCIGALSAEIRNGGETSEGVQALAAIFAAHLAGVLATTTPAAVDEPKAAESR